MSKRIKVLVSVLAMILLVVMGTTTIAMAQEEESTPTPQVVAKGLLDRVSEILGIPQEKLVDALRQARQEMREERFNQATGNVSITQEQIDKFKEHRLERQQKWQERREKALDKAIEKGRITQEDIDEIKEWWEQKPECLKHPRLHISPAMRGRQMIAVPKGWNGPRPYQTAE